MKKVRRVPRKIGGDEDGDNATAQAASTGKHFPRHLVSTAI